MEASPTGKSRIINDNTTAVPSQPTLATLKPYVSHNTQTAVTSLPYT